MPIFESAIATGFLAVATGFAATMSITAKNATDRIASFLPTATVAAYQLILSSYPLKGECSIGQIVLLWITLWVLTLVTAGMALIQHRNETDERASLWDHLFKGGSTAVYPWARAFFSAVAFFFVSFLTPPAPQCLIPWTDIPSGAAWIAAVLLGSIMTLGAVVFPPDMPELRAERAAARRTLEDGQDQTAGATAKGQAQGAADAGDANARTNVENGQAQPADMTAQGQTQTTAGAGDTNDLSPRITDPLLVTPS